MAAVAGSANNQLNPAANKNPANARRAFILWTLSAFANTPPSATAAECHLGGGTKQELLFSCRVGASSLKRTATAARFDGIRVIERKPAFFQTFVKIDRRPIEVEVAFLVDDHAHAVLFGFGIDLFVEAIIETQGIGKTTAAAPGHSNPKNRFWTVALFLQDSLDFLGSLLA
jgi:hypothetical protein